MLPGTLRGYTCTRTATTFRASGNTTLLPGTLSGHTCTRTTATSGNTICYRVHYRGTPVPERQRRLERRGTPGTLSGYTCTRTTATFRTFRTLGCGGYNSGVHVYPCSCRYKKLDLHVPSLCFQALFRFLLVFLILVCLCACLSCSSVCRVPVKTHTNTIAQRKCQNNRQ